MKKKLIFLMLFTCTIPVLKAQNMHWDWARKGNGYVINNNGGYPSGCVTDRHGNTYCIGSFSRDSIIFDGTVLNNPGTTLNNMYLVKYNSSGRVIWAKKAAGSGKAYRINGFDIEYDNGSCLYISGAFSSDTLKLGKFALKNIGGLGKFDFFIAKMDTSGNICWVKSFGGTGGNRDDLAKAIALDQSGHLYVTGSFNSLQFIVGKDTLSLVGLQDVFLMKFDTSGKFNWARSGKGPGVQEIYRVATDVNGNVYVAGNFDGANITFGSLIMGNANGSLGYRDIFLVKYNPSGQVIWAKKAGDRSEDKAYALSCDASGIIYLGGIFFSTKITFGKFTCNNQSSGMGNYFLARYDTMGNVIWARSGGGTTGAEINSLFPANNGNVYLAGDFTSTAITLGSISLKNASGGGTGMSDCFSACYDSSGNAVWALKPFGKGIRMAQEVTAGLNHEVFITGNLYGLDTSLFCNDFLVNSGNNCFIAKLSPCSGSTPVISITGDTSLCQGDSVVLTSSFSSGNFWSDSSRNRSVTVRKSGVYSVSFSDSSCCTYTSAKVRITVHPNPPVPTVTVTGDTVFCPGDSVVLASSPAWEYSWTDLSRSQEIVVKKSGSYRVTITDSNGCKAVSSPVEVTVYPLPAKPVISLVTGNKLESTQAISYTWYQDGVLIPGANSRSIIPSGKGKYIVVVTDSNGCSSTSDEFDYNGSGIYNNPAPNGNYIVFEQDQITGEIRFKSALPVYEIRIYNTSGQLVSQLRLSGKQEATLPLYEKGLFLIDIIFEDKTTIGKLLLK